MKKTFFAFAWLLISAGVILISIAAVSFFYLTKQNPSTGQTSNELLSPLANVDQILEEEPDHFKGEPGVLTFAERGDGRPEIVAKFLERYDSPMKPYDYYGEKLVEVADQYVLDFRLLPAIAMQESNLCKRTHSDAPHNCLGFGIHEQGTLDFDNYLAGFERAAKEIRANYVNEGRITSEDIMKKYTPYSDGSWADSVNQWMAEMRYDDRELGKTLKTNTNVLEFAQDGSASANTDNHE